MGFLYEMYKKGLGAPDYTIYDEFVRKQHEQFKRIIGVSSEFHNYADKDYIERGSMYYSGTRFKTDEECIRDGLIPLQISRKLGIALTPEEKGQYTTDSSVPDASYDKRINALKNENQLFRDQIKKIEEHLAMCEHCMRKEKKDPDDYVIENNQGLEFIKTHDGRYVKAKEIRSYSVSGSALGGEFHVVAHMFNDYHYIEKFKTKPEAEAFLADLIEDEISE
jgi:hypothetical protein